MLPFPNSCCKKLYLFMILHKAKLILIFAMGLAGGRNTCKGGNYPPQLSVVSTTLLLSL